VIWVRGEIVPEDKLLISALDRSFEHGLGLFETFRTWNGHATLLHRHLDRLRRSALELGLPLDPASLPDENAVRTLSQADGREADARFRITLSGGLSATAGATLWMRSYSLPATRTEEGVVLGPAWPARSDRLAGHKTLNYWLNRMMFEDAQAQGFDECVTITPDGSLWECSRSNLFAVVEGEVLTPPSDGRILPGIMRALILDRGRIAGFVLRETQLGLMEPLFRPEEIFLTNSVRGIVPVRQWGEARFPAPGPVTRSLWGAVRSWLESGGSSA
jgi:branched-subunit amino acid aminotransferase/4-amino-4-deoxychorismate lyase